jgi:CheY-like chemotaxis protein
MPSECPVTIYGSAMAGQNRAKTPAILVVEDELLVRLHAVDTVAAAGFEVIEAASADEALQILESRSDIRVVFTDIQMPGSMNGLKLVRAVRNRWPPIKIIVTSGRELLTKDDLPEGGRFFAKPYDPTEICKALREWAL